MMEFASDNTYMFPRRRMVANRWISSEGDVQIIQGNEIANRSGEYEEKMYNDYSFSSSVEVLVNEMKFRIDTRGMDLDLSLTGDPLDQDTLANDYEKESARTGCNWNAITRWIWICDDGYAYILGR